MEEGVRSGDPSGGFVKKKSSSGCLIIRKKGDGQIRGCSSGSREAFDSRKQKKRPRLILSDSESSDESLEPTRGRFVSRGDVYVNGSVAYRNGSVEHNQFGRNGVIESDRQRSNLNGFEFNHANDGKMMRRKGYMDDKLKLKGGSENQRDFETGSSRVSMADKRKHSYIDGTSSVLSGRSGGHSLPVKNRFEMEEEKNEAHLYVREKFREPSGEPIRLQGKNGVLKVMVNKKKKLNLSYGTDDHKEAEDGKGSGSKSVVNNNRPWKQSEQQVSHVRSRIEERVPKLNKSLPTKSRLTRDESETEDSDTSLKLGSKVVQARSPLIGVKDKVKRAAPAEKTMPVGGNEGKVKRGSGTEKQILREKIRSMLVNAGWTIDYRPRRNRDYLDAVYINPAGTAYWSIIKAYEAFQKQLKEVDINIKPSEDSSSFTPLSEETLSKLTRQTRKKIEREMKKKRRGDGGSKNVKRAVGEEAEEGMDGDRKPSFLKKPIGMSVKRRLDEGNHVDGDNLSANFYYGLRKQERSENLSNTTNSHMVNGRKSRKIGRCTLLIRSSDKGLNSESDGFVPYTGKRTLLAWLIDSGIVHLSEKVQYLNRKRTRVMLEGWITRDGIHCGCCSKILTVTKFEIHAGSKLRQPFQNIFLESGASLLQCQIDAWNRQEEYERRGVVTVDVDGDDPNDDTCGLCGDGGDLICCDGCPSTFHLSCLEMQMLPPGDWHCPNCTCKLCGLAGERITQENGRSIGPLLTCSSCQKNYHELCSQDMDDAPPANSNSASASFCGRKCLEIYAHIQKLLGVKHELEAGFSWSLMRRTNLDVDTSHRGFPLRVECNSKLAVALSVMDECFLPIVDRRSGINVIQNVLYNCGSNFSRLNYSGFYTVILERGDEIISAASIRIHGTQLAEMPFIATRHIYRHQGMCRRLFCAIESVLCSLKVEKLIIPAIAELTHTWTGVFGFSPLDESHKQEMRSLSMLVFPGTDMLQKPLVEQEVTEGDIVANSDAKSIEIKDNQGPMPKLEKESEKLVEADLKCSSSGVSHAVLEMVNPVLDTPIRDNILSSVERAVVDEGRENHKGGSMEKVLESFEETSAEKTGEENEHPNLVFDLNDESVVDMVGKFPVASEVLEGDAHEVKMICSTKTLLDTYTTEKFNGSENIVSDTTPRGTDKCVLQLNAVALEMGES